MSGHGSFYWNELATNDIEAAGAFYSALIGWKTQAMPMGDGRTYTLWLVGGQPVGGMFPAKGEPFEGERPTWLSYIAVDDIDATVAKVEGLGGKVLAPAEKIPDVGRIAVIADPQGAAVALIKPTQGEG
ncbi:MAG: VOC family protein [Alphaproteobacteria bacterium]|nr:VOC family protein [Alphaproteobacteria bacterium]